MHRRSLLAAGSGLLVIALAGCAEPAPAASTAALSPTATTTTAAGACSDGEAPVTQFGCDRYTSTSGQSASGEIAWLGTDPLTLQFRTAGGVARVSVQTPCNTLGVPLTVNATAIAPDPTGMTTTLMGCLGDAATREKWARVFFSQKSIEYTVSGQDLTLTAGSDTVHFLAG